MRKVKFSTRPSCSHFQNEHKEVNAPVNNQYVTEYAKISSNRYKNHTIGHYGQIHNTFVCTTQKVFPLFHDFCWSLRIFFLPFLSTNFTSTAAETHYLYQNCNKVPFLDKTNKEVIFNIMFYIEQVFNKTQNSTKMKVNIDSPNNFNFETVYVFHPKIFQATL